MRYIPGRNNLSCTIFVPWDCNNHCKFCTSKTMYKTRECNLDEILDKIKKVNENPVIKEFVLTGGEPLADIVLLKMLLDAIKKPVYVNTTFPLTEDVDSVIKFVNASNIEGINISRHMHQKFNGEVLPYSEFHRIKKPIKLNTVLTKDFDIDEFMAFVEPFRTLDLNDFYICIRADYRKITPDNLKSRDDVFGKLMDKFEYRHSGGCMVCNDDRFYDDDLEISYHRGTEHSLVSYGNRRYVNDVIILMDGTIYPDWSFQYDAEFEKWVFGEYVLDDDMSEYEKDTEFIQWVLEKKAKELKDTYTDAETMVMPVSLMDLLIHKLMNDKKKKKASKRISVGDLISHACGLNPVYVGCGIVPSPQFKEPKTRPNTFIGSVPVCNPYIGGCYGGGRC